MHVNERCANIMLMYNTVTPFILDCPLVALQLYAAALQQYLEPIKKLKNDVTFHMNSNHSADDSYA